VGPALDAMARTLGVAYDAPPLPPPRPITTLAFVPIWRRPWMTIGSDTYGSSLLAHVGIENVYGDTTRYPEVTLDDVRARKPDVVLAPSEPYAFTERHRDELEAVAPVRSVDGKDLFWWGVLTR